MNGVSSRCAFARKLSLEESSPRDSGGPAAPSGSPCDAGTELLSEAAEVPRYQAVRGLPSWNWLRPGESWWRQPRWRGGEGHCWGAILPGGRAGMDLGRQAEEHTHWPLLPFFLPFRKAEGAGRERQRWAGGKTSFSPTSLTNRSGGTGSRRQVGHRGLGGVWERAEKDWGTGLLSLLLPWSLFLPRVQLRLALHSMWVPSLCTLEKQALSDEWQFSLFLFLSPGKLTVELGKFWVPCPLCWLWARWVTHDRSRGSVILGPLWTALNHSDLILYSALCTSCLSPYQMDVCTPAKEVWLKIFWIDFARPSPANYMSQIQFHG